jgi:Fic family protein
MSEGAGRYVSLPAAYGRREAFIPHDLPPRIDYTPGMVALLADAEWAVGGVASVAGFLPNPELLAAPLQHMEAILSVRIEGTQTTADEVFRAEVAKSAPGDEATQEVAGYLAALRLGVAHLGGPQASWDLPLVCRLHQELMGQGGGRMASPGRLREVTVWLGAGGAPIERASYVPPPWQEVEPLMQRWAGYVRACLADEPTVTAPPLLQCAALHAQFELIHPFRDGNGRLGRLLMSLFLIAAGRLSAPLMLLSPYFEQHRREYYDRLRAISDAGDWTGWFGFFLRGVHTQSLQALATARALLDLREQWRARLTQEQLPAYVFALLDYLFENPYTTVERAARQIGMSYPTASKAIGRLTRLGLLEEVTGRKRDREFRATELLRMIERAGHGEHET